MAERDHGARRSRLAGRCSSWFSGGAGAPMSSLRLGATSIEQVAAERAHVGDESARPASSVSAIAERRHAVWPALQDGVDDLRRSCRRRSTCRPSARDPSRRRHCAWQPMQLNQREEPLALVDGVGVGFVAPGRTGCGGRRCLHVGSACRRLHAGSMSRRSRIGAARDPPRSQPGQRQVHTSKDQPRTLRADPAAARRSRPGPRRRPPSRCAVPPRPPCAAGPRRAAMPSRCRRPSAALGRTGRRRW